MVNRTQIFIHPSSLEQPDLEGRAFPVELTREKVEASSRELRRTNRFRSRWTMICTALLANRRVFRRCREIVAPMILPSLPRASNGKADRHFRSVAEFPGYAIHAVDGHIGHLETFLVDDEGWAIRYLVVDTVN